MILYLWTKVRNAWCQSTGSARSSRLNLTKWKTSASTTRYGSAYFLSRNILKMENLNFRVSFNY